MTATAPLAASLTGYKLISGPVNGKTSVYFKPAPVTLPEEERLMFLDWVLFAYPEDADKVKQLPTSLLGEIYEDATPGGEDWKVFIQLIEFIREAESDETKAQQVRALVIEYGDDAEYTYLNLATFFSKAVTSQHSLHGKLKGSLVQTITTDDYTYADLTAAVWYIARELMIVRDPYTKAALITRIEAL